MKVKPIEKRRQRIWLSVCNDIFGRATPAIAEGENMKYKLAIALMLAVGLSTAQEPDNSKKNERDRSDATLTAGKQSNDKKDLQLLRDIRRDVTKTDSFSTYAKNVKIITLNGRVTLRGPVKTQDEKAAIEAIAKKYAGDTSVDSYLEIAPGKP
jgi:hyperosmotically inducible periplasmic protein